MINELLIKIIEKTINERIIFLQRINSGYSRIVYEINDKYILKIVPDFENDYNTLKEVNFLKKNNLTFTPNVVFSDFTKEYFPYAFYVERKIKGEPLLSKWLFLSKKERYCILSQLLQKLEVLHSLEHFSNIESEDATLLQRKFENYIKIITDANFLNDKKINYLLELKDVIPSLFDEAKIGLIHGDLHFNNILVDENNNLHLIDFENLKKSFIEMEFDPINRMARNPNSFNTNSKVNIESNDFQDIMNYIKYNVEEINCDKFDERLLLLDCMNSLRWLEKFPNYDLYNDILFNKSRKLLINMV